MRFKIHQIEYKAPVIVVTNYVEFRSHCVGWSAKGQKNELSVGLMELLTAQGKKPSLTRPGQCFPFRCKLQEALCAGFRVKFKHRGECHSEAGT